VGYRDFLDPAGRRGDCPFGSRPAWRDFSRRAHFPFLKTIDDFNFLYQTSLRLTMLARRWRRISFTEAALADSHGQTRPREDAPGGGHCHIGRFRMASDAYFTTAATLIRRSVRRPFARAAGRRPADLHPIRRYSSSDEVG